jgi:hypothetical protein
MGDLFTPGLPRTPLILLDGYMLEVTAMFFFVPQVMVFNQQILLS